MLVRLILVVLLAVVAWRIVRLFVQSPRSREHIGSGQNNSRHRPSNRPGDDPHSILGVSRNATQAEIKAAYQRQMRAYHPDRLEDMAPELRALAEQRTKEINEAYAKLKNNHTRSKT